MEHLRARIENAAHFRNTRIEFAVGTPVREPDNVGERVFAPEPELAKLKTRESIFAGEAALTKPEITHILDIAETQDATAVMLGTVRDTIRRRTLALRESDEIYKIGLTSRVGGRILSSTIREEWGQPQIINGVRVAGTYSYADRATRMSDPEPTDRQKLESLATEGRMPEASQIADHERLHALQLNIGGPHIPPELLEAQAYRIMPLSHTEVSHNRLVNHIITSAAYTHLDGARFDSAVWSIDRLAALGFSPEQVIQIISNPGQWNEDYQVWTEIDNVITGTMQHFGVTDEGLERKLMMLDLGNEIDRQRARLLTQRTLYHSYQKWISET